MTGALRQIFARPWVNAMLVFVPLGIAAHAMKIRNQTVVFGLNALAIVPLTALLTFATEKAASRLGNEAGALLNITFGNLVELIILSLLSKNHLRMIVSSLLGSILVNVLLILGISLVSASLRCHEQIYDHRVIRMLLCFMTMGISSLLLPTWIHACMGEKAQTDGLTLILSRGLSLVLLFVYAIFVRQQLRSQSYVEHEHIDPSSYQHLLDEESNPKGYSTMTTIEISPEVLPSPTLSDSGLALFPQYQGYEEFDSKAATVYEVSINESEEDESLDIYATLILLTASAGLVSLCAEYMVSSIRHVVADAPLTEAFLGLIVLPLLGNIAEAATAIGLAVRGNAQLAITITVGSAVQVSLFMAPAVVLLGWAFDRNLHWYFDSFQIVAMLAALLLVNITLLSGRYRSFLGIMLCTCYVAIGVGAFLMPSKHR